MWEWNDRRCVSMCEVAGRYVCNGVGHMLARDHASHVRKLVHQRDRDEVHNHVYSGVSALGKQRT